MKKDIKDTKTEFSIGKINRIIGKINKTGLILIVLCYIGILAFALSMIGKDISYVVEPNYEHQYYNNEISPQISLVGVRDFSEGKESLKYSVSVNIAGRLVNNLDPKYKISSFRMFASTKGDVVDQVPNDTYYFTEHNTYSTPITHTYTINNSEVSQHPSTFYVRLEYEKGNKCATEYLLEEDYIKDFINNAVITYNSKDIDLFTLIQDKEAIIGNNRYVGNDYETCIEYILNDRYETMYIFYLDDLLVIQVGHIDEGPKFIAYR